MKSGLNKKLVLITLPVFLLFLGTLAINKNPRQDTNFIPETSDFVKERTYWSERIETAGAKTSYEEFKNLYLKKDLKAQHVGAHLFGDLLYKKLGLSGVATCDSSFAFGCYHIFLTRALIENGLPAVEELNKICLERFGANGAGCQHGLGHGLLEYFGYDHDKLLMALNLCPSSISKNPFVGCKSGVFMEYYSRIVATSELNSLEWRKFDPQNPYDPCPSVSNKESQKICYSQLGLWWDKVLNGDYKKIGDLCNKIDDKTNMKVCFFSIGTFAATLSDYDPEETIAKCDNMPGSETRLLCKSGAYFSFNSFPPSRSTASLICKGIEENRCKKTQSNYTN